MMSSTSADLVIIGAGILGCAVAARASAVGLSTVVVDRLGAAGRGSTGSSAGIVRVHAEDVPGSIMADESLPAWTHWREFAEVPGDRPAARFVQCGTLILDGDSPFAARVTQVMRSARVAYDVLDADQVRGAWPDLDISLFGGPFAADDPRFWEAEGRPLRASIHTPSTGYVGDPALAAQNLLDQAQARGARFMRGRSVTGIQRHGSALSAVLLDDGTRIPTGAALDAAGPESMGLLHAMGADADFTVRTRPVREELHHIPLDPDSSLARSGLHLVDSDLGANWRTDGSAVLAGSNGAACDPLEVLTDPNAFSVEPTPAAWERSVLRVARRVPGMGVPSRVQGLAGVYDVTDDWIPIYDRTEVAGLFVALGTSGNQFKTAPVVAEFLVEMIRRGFDGVDQDANPLRYIAPGTGRAIDTSFFSRRRTPHISGGRG